jgi:hypothetical protein
MKWKAIIFMESEGIWDKGHAYRWSLTVYYDIKHEVFTNNSIDNL